MRIRASEVGLTGGNVCPTNPALMLLLAIAAALLAQSVPAADPNAASVEGVVVNAVSGEPIPRVHVSLNLYSGNEPRSYGALTTAEGKFSVTGLPAGHYGIGASRLGFIFDGRRGSLVLKEGDQKTDLALQLTPSGSIAGTVVDADGQPVEDCGVTAESNRGGQGSQSDAQGRFRIGGLAPGKYRITAQLNEPRTPPEIRTDGTMEVHYSETYYPSALDAAGSSTVPVQAGNETSGIEIRLVRTPIVEVSGKVTGLPEGAGGASVTAQRRQEVRAPWVSRFNFSWNAGTDVKKDGTFAFWRLAPGQYRIQARWFSTAGANMASAPVDVVVADSDVDGIELHMAAAGDLTGQVEYESDDAKPQAPTDQSRQPRQRPPQLMLQGIDGTMGSMSGHVDSTGAFTFEKALPGRYRVMWLGGRGYVKSARLGSSELAGGIVDLSNGVAGLLTVVISAQWGSVSGTVDTGDAPAAGFGVVMLPDNEESAGPMGTQNIRLHADGSYSLDSVPPGTYRIAAVAESDMNEVMQGGDEWEAYASVAETVTVHAGDKATQDLKVLAKQ